MSLIKHCFGPDALTMNAKRSNLNIAIADRHNTDELM